MLRRGRGQVRSSVNKWEEREAQSIRYCGERNQVSA